MMPAIKRLFFISLIILMPLLSARLFAADPPDTRLRTFKGQLEVQIFDDFENQVSEIRYAVRLRQADGTYRIFPLLFTTGQPQADLRSGDTVTFPGRMLDGAIAVDSPDSLVVIESEARSLDIHRGEPPPIEIRRAVVLIVSLNDAQNTATAERLSEMMYTDAQNVKGLYEASSFGQLSFNPDTDGDGRADVFGPFDIDYNGTDNCNFNDWALAADQAATNAGIVLSQYQHRIYSLPMEVACSFAGIARLGCGLYCRVWVRTRPGPQINGIVFAHELGHNLGLDHASQDLNNDGVSDSDYGDESGIMGYPRWGQANAPHRDQLRWFDAFPGSLVVSTGGVYELYALELDPGVDAVGTQVVKIPKPDTKEYYYLSYRRQVGPYPSVESYADRINIHRYAGAGAVRTFNIANLTQGQIFVDDINAIRVTAVAAGGETASVRVSINNAPPVADFSFTANGLSVQFNDASTDSDGTIASWFWDFGDGATSSLADPDHVYFSSGTYTVRLTVTDDEGFESTVSKKVAVDVLNMPPKAGFTYTAGGLSVQFTDASTDSDGMVSSRLWDFGDGATSSQTHPMHTYAAEGDYTVQLTVTDNKGASGRLSQSISVKLPANQPPLADFDFTASGLTVSFTPSSSDPDGAVESYEWDFGDGGASSEQSPEHVYGAYGKYTVVLTIVDDRGASSAVEKALNLQSSPPPDDGGSPDGGSADGGSGGGGGGCFIGNLTDPVPPWRDPEP